VGGRDEAAQYSHRLGFSAWKAGKPDEARRYLAAALDRAPDNPYLLREIAGTYTSMGETRQAKVAFERLYPLVDDEEQLRHLDRILDALGKMD
jgi:Tfp pilus assembly protein PilF